MKKPRILFHANAAAGYAGGHYAGIHRVTYELLLAISKERDLPFEFEIYTQGLKSRKQILGSMNLNHHQIYTPNNSFFPALHEYLPFREAFLRYDLFHVPHNFEYFFKTGKCVVTLHDMLLFVRQKDFPASNVKDQLVKLPRLIKGSKGIITCSESSRRDIENYLQVGTEKIRVLPWGIRHDLFFPDKENARHGEFLKTIGITFPFFLSISCGTDRKNTQVLLAAYTRLVKNNPSNHLVLIWPNVPSYIMETIERNKLGEKVHILNPVDDKTLAVIYNQATALLFPSKYEGFGLPVAESLACGTPAVIGNNSSLPEVAGDAGIYIQDVEDAEEWRKIMEKFENKGFDIDGISKRGIIQAGKFTWEKNAKQTLEYYSDLL
ncbi:MAG: glycosyltransferase family 1 protein [Bacteroidetes bacterium]|nr:glycosyltransferase family 1 protein [Bacteroidota bacterium]